MEKTSLAKRLNWARKRARLTQVEVANRSGMAQGQYCRLERGECIKTARIAQLAHIFGVDPYWLATGEGSSEDVNNSTLTHHKTEEIQSPEADDMLTNSIVHTFNLRRGFKIELELPSDLTEKEAERLAIFIKSLPM